MRQELEDKLYEKYPDLFRQKNWEMDRTCMIWGIETGDGWFEIIGEMCESIMKHVADSDKIKCPEFSQVKEKFGLLRVYVDYGDDAVDRIVDHAESKSGLICEICGSAGKRTTKGWSITRCDTCKETKG